ncbi:MAG: hypothetical protein HFJ36_06160 [Clostridia bacterium]|nr:hypothetical protein [Clostridia bacterium]
MKSIIKTKNEEKANKGITLIALVITIIVLIILATITISTLVGENGVLTKTDKAKTENRGATVEEEKDIWKADKVATEKTNVGTTKTLEQLLEDLLNRDLITEEEKATIESTGKVTIGNREIVFNEEDNIIEYENYELLISNSVGEIYEDGMLWLNFCAYDNETFLSKIFNYDFNTIVEQKSDEEIYLEIRNHDNGTQYTDFGELIENELGQRYETLREAIIDAIEGDNEAYVNKFIESIRKQYKIFLVEKEIENLGGLEIYRQDGDGTNLYYKYDKIPYKKADYIYTAKLGSKVQKFKVSIEQYEVAMYNETYRPRLIALDIINKKHLKINSAEIKNTSTSANIECQVIDDDIENRCYVDTNNNIKVGGELKYDEFKAVLTTDQVIIEGYFYGEEIF